MSDKFQQYDNAVIQLFPDGIDATKEAVGKADSVLCTTEMRDLLHGVDEYPGCQPPMEKEIHPWVRERVKDAFMHRFDAYHYWKNCK